MTALRARPLTALLAAGLLGVAGLLGGGAVGVAAADDARLDGDGGVVERAELTVAPSKLKQSTLASTSACGLCS